MTGRAIRLICTFATFLLAIASAAHAQSTNEQPGEDSWKTLETEPSRADLFRAAAQPPRAADSTQVFVFPYSFQFPTNAERDVNGTARLNSWFGIDISHYNGVNFPIGLLSRQKVAFVYMKATQGTDYADKTFGVRWRAMEALPSAQRIPRGAYHFLSSDKSMSGTAQADRFLAYVGLHGGFEDGDLRPALDLEWDLACRTCADRWADRTAYELVTTTLDFVRHVKEKSGWTPLIYTNRSFLKERGLTAGQVQQITQAGKIWIFDLTKDDRTLELANPTTDLPYVLWQFSWGGSLSGGYTGQLNVDSFKGTNAEFQAIFMQKN
jgi:lysozyme